MIKVFILQRPHDGGRDVGSIMIRTFAATEPTSDKACEVKRHIFGSVSKRRAFRTCRHIHSVLERSESKQRTCTELAASATTWDKACDIEHTDPEARHSTKQTESEQLKMRQLRHRHERSSPGCLPIIILDPTIHESRPGTRNRAGDHKRWQQGG